MAAALALAAGLSGCVVFKGPVTAKQVGTKPKVAVTFTLCNSDGGASEPMCPNAGNSGDAGGGGATAEGEQVLLGFRVPAGTRAPDRIRSSTAGVTGAFRPLRRYSRELKALLPRDDFRWLGYAASPLSSDDGGNDAARYDRARFRVVLRVPDRLVGKRFKVRPVVGWHDDADTPEGLDCGPNPFEYYADGSANRTICIDAPTRERTARSVGVKIEPRA